MLTIVDIILWIKIVIKLRGYSSTVNFNIQTNHPVVGKETPNLNQKSLGFLAPGAPRSGECPSESEDRDSLGLQRNLTADTADFNGDLIHSRR